MRTQSFFNIKIIGSYSLLPRNAIWYHWLQY